MDKELQQEPRKSSTSTAETGRWLALSIGSLLLAGCFSLLPLVARIPGLNAWLHDPHLARRCLVVHVNLALEVWFFAFLAALATLLPTRRAASTTAPTLAATGVLALVIAGGLPGAVPVLSNYIPMIDHPLFMAGLLVFFGAVAMRLGETLFAGTKTRRHGGTENAETEIETTSDRRRGATTCFLPEVAVTGLKAAAFAFLVGFLTLVITLLMTPITLERRIYYELVFWGPGHVFQFVHIAGMLTVWLLLIQRVAGRPVLSRRSANVLFGLLVAPLAIAPFLALAGPTTAVYHDTFTVIMQFGIFPSVLFTLAASARALTLARREGVCWSWSDARVAGFLTSAALAVTGFLLGASIRSSSTLIPAHYHASIGAVTAAYMTYAYGLLEVVGLPQRAHVRLAAVQPALFGVGQLIFALGFGYAGLHGMGRKLYGTEQHVRSTAEWLGLSVMGVGGLLAIVGGIAFLYLMFDAVRPRVWMPARELGKQNA